MGLIESFNNIKNANKNAKKLKRASIERDVMSICNAAAAALIIKSNAEMKKQRERIICTEKEIEIIEQKLAEHKKMREQREESKCCQ